MQLLHSQNRINELLSRFVTQVKGFSAMNRTDLNLVAETVLIPLFSEVFGYKNLKNLNAVEENNYPGIDLGDDIARVAFQITASSDSEKIKHTLRQFVKYKHYEKYNKLIIYILSEKQGSYSGSGYEEIIEGRFSFDKDTDIIDYRDVLRLISTYQIDKATRIQNILEAHFGESKVPIFGSEYIPQKETVFLNYLEIFFPDRLYVANLNVDVSVSHSNRGYRRRLHRGPSPREKARMALDNLGYKFATDWDVYEKKLITFYNLEDEGVPLRHIIDEGTIETFNSREFYSIDENYERVFKSLLRRTLQNKLYRQGVSWQNELHLFIFNEKDGQEKRVEQWRGKKTSEREVYVRTMKDNKSDEILNCKHFAFGVKFRQLGKRWFLQIIPEWFFSYDGYHKHLFAHDDVTWLKRHENNSHVANHVQFIAYFLKKEEPNNLFGEQAQKSFLAFGELLSFDNAPYLNDDEWRPPTKDKGDDIPSDTIQAEMDFDL